MFRIDKTIYIKNILIGKKKAHMTDQARKQRQEQGERDWYEVEIEGHINPGWFDWIDTWEIIPLPSGNTLLTGWVLDQPALHGIFARIRDMNLKIISLNRSAPPQSDETQGRETGMEKENRSK